MSKEKIFSTCTSTNKFAFFQIYIHTEIVSAQSVRKENSVFNTQSDTLLKFFIKIMLHVSPIQNIKSPHKNKSVTKKGIISNNGMVLITNVTQSIERSNECPKQFCGRLILNKIKKSESQQLTRIIHVAILNRLTKAYVNRF